MSLLDALLGIREVLSSGAPVTASRALNFKGDARAAFNPSTGRIDAEVIAGSSAPSDTVAGTSYTFGIADISRRKKFTAATTVTATVPPSSSVAWPTDAVIYPVQYGAGQVVIEAGVGVTINVPPSFSNHSLEQFSTLVLTYEGSNVWTLGGLLEAGAALPSNVTYGGSGWDDVNTLQSGVGAGLRGHATNGLWTAVLFSCNAIPSGTGYLASHFNGAGDGWRMYHNGANLTFDVNSNGSTAAPVRTIVAGDLDKLQLWVCQWDTARTRSYFGRAEVGSGTIVGSYTISANTERLTMGLRNNGTAPAHSGITIYGFAGGNTALTLGEVQALFDAVKVADDIVVVPSKTAALYSVSQDRVGAAFPNGLTDRSGSANLTFTAGSASGIVLETRNDMAYGW